MQNPDILHEISARTAPAPDSVIVGFAAETGDDTGSVLDLARAKLARKGCDLLVVNDVSGGAVFGSPDNEAVILGADGSAVEVPRGSKTALAHVIWDRVDYPVSNVTAGGPNSFPEMTILHAGHHIS